MKFKYLLILSILLIYGKVLCQSTVGGVSSEGIDMNARASGMVTEIPMEEPRTIGNSYLYDSWLTGKLTLKNGQVINHLPIKYDLNNNYFELKTENGVKALNGIRVKTFTLDNECATCYYINRSEFKFNEKIIRGFMRYVYGEGGNYSLFEEYTIELVKAQYNAALDLGERNNKIVKKSNYVIVKNDQTITVEKSKRRFANKFENKDAVYSFLKDKRLTLKVVDDLKILIDFLNAH